MKKYIDDSLQFLLKYLFGTVLFFGVSVIVHNISDNENNKNHDLTAPFLNIESAWADTLIERMSIDEKIAQLVFLKTEYIDSTNFDSIFLIIKNNKPGGIFFKNDSLKNYIDILNEIQKKSVIPLLSGLVSKNGCPEFNDFLKFPNLNAINAIKSDSLRARFYEQIAIYCKQLGIHINFIPTYIPEIQDSNFRNDYVNNKISFIQNLQNDNILTCFNEKNFFECDSVSEVYNKRIIESGLSCIHKSILPLKDSCKNSRSEKIHENLNFGGLVFSDISDLEENFQDSILRLINSGTEIFISKKPKSIICTIKYLLTSEKISETQINFWLKRILLAKTWAGLNNYKPINKDSVIFELNSAKNKILSRELYQKSLTLIKNKDIVPYKSLKGKRFYQFTFGKKDLSVFSKTLKTYYTTSAKYIDLEKHNTKKPLFPKIKNSNVIITLNDIKIDTSLANKITKLSKQNKLIVVNFRNTENASKFDSIEAFLQVYDSTESEQEIAANILFGGDRAEGKLSVHIDDSISYGTSLNTETIRLKHALPEEAGIDSKMFEMIDSVARAGIYRGAYPGCQIFIAKDGKIIYDKAFGYHTYAKHRSVKKTDIYDLASITKIAATTLASMKLYEQGKIRLNDKLGKYFKDLKIDYSNIKNDTIINLDTLYLSDIKDIKKLLKHQDTAHINDSMIIAYDSLIIRLTPKNNIFKVKIRELLVHKSGISPALPILPYLLYKKYFYDSLEVYKKQITDTLSNTADSNVVKFNIREEIKKRFSEYFTRKYIKDSSEVKIADGFYLQNRYFDTLWKDTKRLRVYSRKIYQYSDINMILLQQAIDTLNNRSLDKYLSKNIYQPMGLQTMCFKPRNRFNRSRIIPTEYDKYWREQVLVGNVHDPSAAMLGGVSGNAGLFSNARDLGTLGQMWLNGGKYGGIRYLTNSTVNAFSGFQEDSHRGLGFDKPARKTIIGNGAPKESYGHTGFTGTCIWVDPVYNLVYVFVSNRVHPNQKNWRINGMRIRQKIHTIVYDAIKKGVK